VDRVPLTAAQRKLLLHHRLYPGDAALNITVAYRIRGDFDLGRLRAALQRILSASVALNTTFDSINGEDVALRHVQGARVEVLTAPPADSPDAEAAAVAG
jgi:hypothetical protein